MRITIVSIGLVVGMIAIASCTLGQTASISCEFNDGTTSYLVRRHGRAIDVSTRSDGDETSMASMGVENATRGALMIDAGDTDGTMLVLSSSDTTRVEVSGQSDVVPDVCQSLPLSLASVPVKAGDNVSVRGFNADGEQLFMHSGSVRANSSSTISSIGTPPST
jgi:hypothetical protein